MDKQVVCIEPHSVLMQQIVKILSESTHSLCGYDIYRQIQGEVDRLEVGRILLENPRIFVCDGNHPPQWRLREEKKMEKERDPQRRMYVYCDVSNIPQCVPLLIKYENLDYIRVYGFEDYQYNGKEKLKKTIKATCKGKNYADMLLSHKFILQYTRNKGQGIYIICSKDSYFDSFPLHYKDVHLVSNVNDLERLLIV